MIIAMVSLLGSVGISVPRRIERHRAHQQANEEILRQQEALINLQERIRTTQARILQVQAELTSEAQR